jgi:pimeloyl-ACP methyl ester carboxylesterase
MESFGAPLCYASNRLRHNGADELRERMTRHIVTTNQASIDTSIDGHGPAVVVIPSYGRDAGGDFDPLTTALVAAGYRMLRPEPRGVAGSSGPMSGVTFADMAGDIAQMIDDLADGPAVLLGHAFGNFVGLPPCTSRHGGRGDPGRSVRQNR